MMSRPKREWVIIAKRVGPSTSREVCYYLNSDVYTDLDEPLRLARKCAERNADRGRHMRVWKKAQDVLLSTYRTSSEWGEPHTAKLPLDEIWPIFETYARML